MDQKLEVISNNAQSKSDELYGSLIKGLRSELSKGHVELNGVTAAKLASVPHSVLVNSLLNVLKNLSPFKTLVKEVISTSIHEMSQVLDLDNQINSIISDKVNNVEQVVLEKLELVSSQSTLNQKISELAIQQSQKVSKQIELVQNILSDLPKPEPIVLDYSQIKFPATMTSEPVIPVNIKEKIKESTEDLQRRNNIMVYGLRPEANSSAKQSVKKMFQECGINSISSQSNNIVSAHFMSRPDSKSPVLRVIMSNQWIVRDILDVSRDLKGTCYNHVYLSNDRSKEEREKRRLLITELKSNIANFPGILWSVRDGAVVNMGPKS